MKPISSTSNFTDSKYIGCRGWKFHPNTPGHWRRGQEGELDETRLVDALAGEANVFRRDFSLKADGMIESPQSKLERLR